jgi:predicted metal-dependent hydrolase
LTPASEENALPHHGTILFLSEDLLSFPGLQDLVRGMGYELLHIQRASELDAEGEPVDRPTPLTEPLTGAEAGLIARLSEVQPALMIVDLSTQRLAWDRWIQVIKTSAATRRIPIIAYGPHVQVDTLKTARSMGADLVVSRGRFHRAAPELIQEWARTSSHTQLREACEGELPPLVVEGIKLLNQQEFYQAHELLENAWMAAERAEGYMYRALLQVDVAYLQLQRGNLAGVLKMLLRVRQWIDPLPAKCRGVDIAALRYHLEDLRALLATFDAENLNTLAPEVWFKPVGMAS